MNDHDLQLCCNNNAVNWFALWRVWNASIILLQKTQEKMGGKKTEKPNQRRSKRAQLMITSNTNRCWIGVRVYMWAVSCVHLATGIMNSLATIELRFMIYRYIFFVVGVVFISLRHVQGLHVYVRENEKRKIALQKSLTL